MDITIDKPLGRPWFVLGRVTLVFSLLFFGLSVLMNKYKVLESVRPGHMTLSGFLKLERVSEGIKHTHKGEEVLVVGIRSKRSFASGPPRFVFDSRGHLRDWTWDSGDDPDWIRRWGFDQVRWDQGTLSAEQVAELAASVEKLRTR